MYRTRISRDRKRAFCSSPKLRFFHCHGHFMLPGAHALTANAQMHTAMLLSFKNRHQPIISVRTIPESRSLSIRPSSPASRSNGPVDSWQLIELDPLSRFSGSCQASNRRHARDWRPEPTWNQPSAPMKCSTSCQIGAHKGNGSLLRVQTCNLIC